jgi:nucleotide-binding universal stress UspA family protein
MFGTILVPLDGSTLAARAVPFATAFARAAGARLVLIRAVRAEPVPSEKAALAQRAARRRAEVELGVVVDQLRQEGLTAEARVSSKAAPEAIVDAARQQHANLIVMSTHGRSGIGRWLYGSVADRVLQRTRVPVLLIPPSCERTCPAEGALRLLVPLDGSELAERALGFARAVAGTAGEVLLYRVLPPSVPIDDGDPLDPYWTEVFAEARANVLDYLESVAAPLRAAGCRVRLAVEHGARAQRIAEYARREKVDLVVLSSHGRAGVARWLLGSVAEELLRDGRTPLLLLRPLAEAAHGATWADAPGVDFHAIQPGYPVYAHHIGPARRTDRGQFVGVVEDVLEHQGIRYVHVRGGLGQANELFLPVGAIHAVVGRQVHLNLSREDLAGQVWHLAPNAMRPAG